MSGGSFNYLYRKSLGEALQDRASMEEMITALERTASLGWYDDKPQGQDVASPRPNSWPRASSGWLPFSKPWSGRPAETAARTLSAEPHRR